jgi:hypothetical protein
MRFLPILVACAVFSAAAGPAEAQQTTDPPQQTAPPQSDSPTRPYGGLFAMQRVPTTQTLTFMGTMGTGYDTNILSGGPAAVGSGISTPGAGPAQPSTFENGSASLSYSFAGRHISFGATGGTSANYYAALRAKPLTVGDTASAGVTWTVTPRTSITGNVVASYGPVYSLPGVPAVPTAPDSPDQTNPASQASGQTLVLDSGSTLLIEDHVNVMGGIALSHSLTRRASFSLSYGYNDVTSPSHSFDLSVQSYSGSFSYLLAKGLSAQLGYSQSSGRFGVDQTPTTSRGLTGGLNFNRALSITRRTTLSFGSGLSALSNPAIRNGDPQYYLQVQASLVHEMGRTWTSSLSYNRSASFVATFVQPVLADSLTAGIGGRLSHRLQLQASAGVSSGTIGFTGSTPNGFRAYFASTGLRADVGRSVSAGIDYAYYRYRFASGVQLPVGVGFQSDTQSVRVYVSVWAPIISSGRRQ